ncbi:hypothetical protein HK098_006521 [Nowakowskiella sp. JEL0407]|nr:hypothetical protein HK098_006521 [Nowakowskiella sp. JEL0407]
MSESQDELAPTSTAGYRVGAKKTAAELAQLDAEDESLRKWKESLGLKADASSGGEKQVIVECLALEVEGRQDVILPLSTPAEVARAADRSLTIKEGVEYRFKVKFKVYNDVVTGLKYLHAVKRGPMRVDRMEEMLGSYGPQQTAYEKKVKRYRNSG